MITNYDALFVVGEAYNSFASDKQALTISQLEALLQLPASIVLGKKRLLLGQGVGEDACDAILERLNVAALAQLSGQAHGTQVGEGGNPLTQAVEVGRELARSAGLTRAVGRRFEAALDVLADRLRIAAGPAGDGGDGQALSVQVQDHDEFSQQDHPRRSQPIGIGGHGG